MLYLTTRSMDQKAGIRYIATASAELLRFRNIFRPLSAIDDFRSEFKMVKGAHKGKVKMRKNTYMMMDCLLLMRSMYEFFSFPFHTTRT